MASETTSMSKEQLHGTLKTRREELFKLRQQAVTDKVADTSSFKKSRKEIARLLTEINARRHAAASKDAGKKDAAKGATKKK
ncbi:MAG TPA: 50S ribosomal protein L29 [Phycisphaerales bacterium]|nr:50S ribosomal protein L29 [Phycisphaerales bacterium]